MLHPATGIDEIGEAHRMALREPVVRERRQLVVDDVARGLVDTVRAHTFVEPGLQPLHPFGRTLRPHRLTQLVGLRRREPGDVDGHLHELFLEQRDAERLLQRLLEQRMQVGDGLEPVAAADVGMHRPTLDRTGADERHLDNQVVERARLQAGQRGHLGPALDLEDTDGVGATDHLVDVVLLGDLRQFHLGPVELADQVDAVVQCAQHSQAEQVELHQTCCGAVVFVPLQHGAQGRARGGTGAPGTVAA